MSGTLKIGGKTLATHNSNTNVAKIQLGSADDVVLTDSAGNSILTENGSVVTLNNVDTATIGSNALVVDSSGNVGVGTNSPNKRLSVLADSGEYSIAVQASAINLTKGYAITGPDGSVEGVFTSNAATGEIRVGGIPANYFITCYTSGVERMRIGSNGNVGIGTTSTGNRLSVSSSDTTSILTVMNGSTSTSGPGCIQTSLSGTNQNNTNCFHLKATTQNVNSWYLYGNGSSSFSSDERIKKNIETTRDGYIEDVKNLRVVKYHWKDQDESTPKELGLIAQEVEQVFPGLIQEHELENVGDDIKHIKTSVIPFILIKAIQEQQALIESQQSQIDALTARIDALEAT